MARQLALGEQYQANNAFAKTYWTPLTIGGHYFKSFNGATYQDASRIARDFNIITPPLRQWRYMIDKEKKGEALGWDKVDFNDAGWKTTDVIMDTWSLLASITTWAPCGIARLCAPATCRPARKITCGSAAPMASKSLRQRQAHSVCQCQRRDGTRVLRLLGTGIF